MRHIVAIAKRELRSYFVSSIAYVALTAYALMSGYFFNSMVVYYVRQASLADRQVEQLGRSPLQLDVPTVILEQFFRNQGSFVLLLILPLLTMGLLADERRKGTLELLLTSPVRPVELTLGKFAGALTFFLMRFWSRRYLSPPTSQPSELSSPRRKREVLPQQPLRDAPADISRWQVEMHDLARDLKGELDTKMVVLQRLIIDAREQADRLEKIVERAAEVDSSTPQR